MDDVVELVRRSLADETATTFAERVEAQADRLRAAIEAGEFDSEDYAVGLEVELYAINREPDPVEDDPEPDEADLDDDLSGGGGASLEPSGSLESPADGNGDGADEDGADPPDGDGPYMDPEAWEGRLATLPESAFGGTAAKELGLHNAEVNTDPDALDATGLAVQTTSVEMRIKKARDAAREENRDLVLDAMWTVPPAAGSEDYLTDVTEYNGVVVAANMRQDPRYVALDNEALAHAGGSIDFSVPGAEHTFPTILFESLTTSIQPHLQIPDSDRFPDHYNAAIRTLGPVLALTVNSPFLPADLYNRVGDPETLLEETHHELRIAAFEQSVNTSENPKVRVPADIDAATDVIDRVVADDTFAPFLREWLTDDERTGLGEFWEFDHKRGTFWRWLRCVVGGDPVDGAGDERSLRIEYRPIPTQPTVRDINAAQALTVGLLRGLVARDHPLAELPWQDARQSFYSAARDGLDAELAWVTADGERTTDHATIYGEVFDLAGAGLAACDVPDRDVEDFLAPLERRYEAGTTPAAWKIARVREHLRSGRDLAGALGEMQREYHAASAEHDCFADWL